MKIVFMGTPDFAVPTLNALVRAGHEILCVVAQPDKPKGRGKKTVSPPTIQRAKELGIPTKQPRAVRRGPFVQWINNCGADVGIVIAYGRILIPEVLNAPKFGCINVHASLLPKYRGAAPIHWSVINGEKKTGVCTMQMNEGMDTGDVLLVSETDILSNETTAELWDRLSILGSELLIETLENLHSISPTPQLHEEASYAPLISKSIGRIDWSLSANEIHNLIRGCVSWPVAHCEFRGKVMKIWQSTVLDMNTLDIPTGTIIQTKPFPVVSTGLGALELKEIQLPGKKRCDASALTNGFQITIGESLEFSTTEVL
jgi:methionyl-tRNA formyltransferase